MVGAAIWIIGSCVLGLRALFKKYVRIVRVPCQKEKKLYSHAKVLINFDLIENPNDKDDMEDILNTAFYESTGWIIITHRLTSNILLETLRESPEFDKYEYEGLPPDELLKTFLPGYTCLDADIIERNIDDELILYAAKCYEDIKILDNEGDNDDDIYQ